VPTAELPITEVTTVDDGVETVAFDVVGSVAELVVDGEVKEELVKVLVTICEKVVVDDEGVECGAVLEKDDAVEEVVVIVEETIVEETLVTVDIPPIEVDGVGTPLSF